jgi:endo-1,4-beta-mannosidase
MMLLHDGRPWLGANFWSRSGGPLMWRTYDPDLVTRELAVLAQHGMNLTRSFFYWPDFHPEPDRIDEEMVERYADFLDRHTELGMATVPTFIVGHMSGENWDPAWRQGRDLYGDVWMVGRQAWFVEQMTARFHTHPAVAGWLMSNEMPIYGDPAPRETVTAWAQLMVQAVRAGGGTQPVSIGDGAWGMEITGADNGFSVRDLGALTDFVGPHVYRMENDVVRQHLTAAFVCELADFGKPVVLEEFGVTDAFVSREHAAHYYRQLLHNSLLAGATGWIGWNNSDYDNLYTQPPYSHHPFEMRFGLTDVTGEPKPALREFGAFAEILERVDLPRCARPESGTALVVPSYLEHAYPFTEPDDHTHVFDVLRQAYVAAREADLPVRPARERDGLPADQLLYLVPSTKQLTGPAWRDLASFAENGSVVYVSYSPGNHRVQRGLWHADLNGMFGVEHQLRYGLVDPVTDDEVAVTFVADFGGIAEGTILTFRAGGNENARSFLPVRATDAEVVAVDQHGNPVLLRRSAGAGHLVLCTFPFEAMAAALPHVNPEPTYRIYDALAVLAGVSRAVTVADPLVHACELRHRDGERFVWLVSQAEGELTVKPVVTGQLTDLASGEATSEVTLHPYGVRVLALRDS